MDQDKGREGLTEDAGISSGGVGIDDKAEDTQITNQKSGNHIDQKIDDILKLLDDQKKLMM